MIIQEKNDVQVAEVTGEKGTEYKVVFRGKDVLSTTIKEQALDAFQVLQPQKAKCSKCGTMDIVVFKGRVGAGRFRIPGDGGWIIERIFGGLSDHRDVVYCPECATEEDAKYNEYLERKKSK